MTKLTLGKASRTFVNEVIYTFLDVRHPLSLLCGGGRVHCE